MFNVRRNKHTQQWEPYFMHTGRPVTQLGQYPTKREAQAALTQWRRSESYTGIDLDRREVMAHNRTTNRRTKG